MQAFATISNKQKTPTGTQTMKSNIEFIQQFDAEKLGYLSTDSQITYNDLKLDTENFTDFSLFDAIPEMQASLDAWVKTVKIVLPEYDGSQKKPLFNEGNEVKVTDVNGKSLGIASINFVSPQREGKEQSYNVRIIYNDAENMVDSIDIPERFLTLDSTKTFERLFHSYSIKQQKQERDNLSVALSMPVVKKAASKPKPEPRPKITKVVVSEEEKERLKYDKKEAQRNEKLIFIKQTLEKEVSILKQTVQQNSLFKERLAEEFSEYFSKNGLGTVPNKEKTIEEKIEFLKGQKKFYTNILAGDKADFKIIAQRIGLSYRKVAVRNKKQPMPLEGLGRSPQHHAKHKEPIKVVKMFMNWWNS